ncbi:Na+/H+ antiporter subunit D [Qingshengfaniella alkalisoli]|uniref:Na+/H+ antiporter subunit D n=1 Tax=Qingshengfaniella alkalisoli TaxID=2599296 RepID=A0A5B8IZN5_9RHOB|nr:Na+/H+ antiporter subunit D [Qingshengfaniella alkalisoli]QDY70078.1 Na+/H+ antiporter subunit D [Qingshengfaniella alkalisoli]
MSWYLSMPLIVPFATAIISYLLRDRAVGRWSSVLGSVVALGFALLLMAQVLQNGIVAGQMGNWPAPFGITLVADYLSAIMVVITGIVGVTIAIYATGDIAPKLEQLGFHAMFQILLAGVTGAFLTGDLFNLYVWFEVMLISSFGLLVLGGKPVQIDGAVKYVALNLVSTVLFLTAIAILYGMTGSLNLADLGRIVPNMDDTGLVTVVAMLFMIAFGVKAAVFPLFFWLPASYHTPTFSVSALFAALLTKVGVYALIRMFTLVFTHDIAFTHTILLWVACLTMVTGVVGAAAQTDFRKVLSFHIISQIGYMVLGLALYTPLAIAGAVFYLVHHIIVKANLFLVSGVAERTAGSTDLYKIGGLYSSAPLLAALFVVPAFSLAGFPPLSGFWAKYVLVKASLDLQFWWAAFAALAVGLLTIFSMTKIWGEAFWKPHPDRVEPTLDLLGWRKWRLLTPIAILAAGTLIIGLFPAPFFALAETAAGQLLSPEAYIEAVLGVTQ